jgi:hypothetical protein
MKKLFTSFVMFLAIIGLWNCAFAQIPTSGLIGYYPFSGNANDLSGYSQNGVVYGATLTTDRFGNANSAYYFNGISDYISLVPSTNFIGLNKYTYSVWMEPTAVPTQLGGFLYSVGSASDGIGQALGYQPATSLFAGSYNVGSDPGQSYSQSAPMAPNQWMHVVVTRDTANIKMYVNDDLITVTSYSDINNQEASYGSAGTENAIIGGRCNLNSESFFTGVIDDIRIYNRVLSTAEINALYNEGKSFSISITDDTICHNTDAQVLLLNSKSGVSYQLSVDSVIYGGPQTGNSGTLTFNILPSALRVGINSINVTADSSSHIILDTTLTLSVNPLPIAFAGNNQTVCAGSSVTLTATGGSIYAWSGGVTQGVPFIPSSTKTYTVTVTGTDGCSASNSVTITVDSLPAKVSICYVEFDTSTYKNSIIWATNLPANIDTVHVYNEVSTNVWKRIGSVPATQGYFIDVNSNPFNESYSYKISAKDTCGNEADTSSLQTTITLLATYDFGTNTYGFTWSPYQGLAVPNYFIYGIDGSGMDSLIGTTLGNQYFYNYTNPYLGFIKFFVGFNTPSCTYTGRVNSKTVTSGEHLVRSNYVQSTITGINEHNSLNNLISVYPNPVTNNLQIQTGLQIKNIEVTDVTGRLLFTSTLRTIDCSNFAKGVYFTRVTTEKGVVVKKFVKE